MCFQDEKQTRRTSRKLVNNQLQPSKVGDSAENLKAHFLALLAKSCGAGNGEAYFVPCFQQIQAFVAKFEKCPVPYIVPCVFTNWVCAQVKGALRNVLVLRGTAKLGDFVTKLERKPDNACQD